MSVRQSLLALLSEQPRHGYELKAEFDARTGHSWPLNIGQVYTTLDRLERDSLVVRGDEGPDGRVTYSITAQGRAEVEAWFAGPVSLSSPPRDEMVIKIALAATLPAVNVTHLIQVQRHACVAQLQDYVKSRRAADPDDLTWQLVVEHLIHSLEADLRWLDHCQAAVGRATQHPRRGSASTVTPDENSQPATSSEASR